MVRILVIDDEDLVRDTISRILRTGGHEVAEASDGRKGLALFSKNPADLVITDILMPEMEGIQTIGEFRKIAPRVKIIAISGGGRVGNKDYLTLARELGADAILSKPFRARELLAAVDSVIGTAQ